MELKIPTEHVLIKNSTASKEYQYNQAFSKLGVYHWPKQVKNLRLVLRLIDGDECKVYKVTKVRAQFPMVRHDIFWFEYDMVKTECKLYCVLL